MKDARTQAFIAEKLSELLLDAYQNKHLPRMVEEFDKAGFSKRSLLRNPRNVFLMLIVATYDRRPFTASAGAHEYIWGIKDKDNSLPVRLTSLGLSDPVKVNSMSQSKIKEMLKKEKINELALDTDGYIDYSKMISNAAFSWEYLHKKLIKASNIKDVTDVFNILIHIHGIGDSIASKLIKSFFREIGIGSVKPHDFPLSVVWPLINEFHTEQAITKLRRIGSDIVPLTMGVLFEKREPFALDSLFYLNRYEPDKLEDFINEMNSLEGDSDDVTETPLESDIKAQSMDKIELLLGIIEEINDGIHKITSKELGGMVQTRQLRSTAVKIHKDMKKFAFTGDIENMYLYYQKSLISKASEWDWLIEKCGRKSMSSEWTRFKSACKDND